jgi:transaldolase / glucose-6-phosphate isomerase
VTHPAIDARATAGEITNQTARRGVNPLKGLQEFGQSIWLDDLRRSLFTSGEFSRLVAEDGLRGVTSNPSIFEKAITGSTDYATAIQEIEQWQQLAPMALYERVAIRDIREAADLLRPVYNATSRGDGYASLEVSPYVAHDTAATIEEARRLWKAVDRDNVMIKVPASIEGVSAIRQLISEGINVNVTLLFGIDRYHEVACAYLEGLSAFVQNGGDPAQVSSVASFFVSRVDTIVDEMITKVLATVTHPSTRASLMSVQGKVGIANAKLAYQHYLRVGRSTAWRALALNGAYPQRLLWASTSTKNPRYRDVRYIEELIGRDTINTMTPATLESFRDHGQAQAASLETGIDDAHQAIETLERMGISLRKVTDRLLEDGITGFRKSFDSLLVAVAPRRVPKVAGAGLSLGLPSTPSPQPCR